MRPIRNGHFIDKLNIYIKDWSIERLTQDRTGKILNRDAYNDLIAWCNSKHTVIIPSYALFNRHCEQAINWFKYTSQGKTYLHGYRMATDAEMAERDALKAVEIVKQVTVIVEPQNEIPDWQRERNELARIERMENLAKSRAMREWKEAKNETE